MLSEIYLFEHSKQHFPAEVTECGCFVRVDDEAVRPDLHVLVSQGLGVEHYLDDGPLPDLGHRVDGLQHVLTLVVVPEHQQPLRQPSHLGRNILQGITFLLSLRLPYLMFGKLLVDEGCGEGLEILEGEVRDVHRDLVLHQPHLEAEADLLPALLRHHDPSLLSVKRLKSFVLCIFRSGRITKFSFSHWG